MEPIRVQGRTLTGEDLTFLRALLAQHPHWNRTTLSRQLCERWDWRNGAGRLKDMAARTLLRKLQARGLLALPPPALTRPPRPAALPPSTAPPSPLAPLTGSLHAFQPVSLALAHDVGPRRQVRQWLRQYHYRGFAGPVGENVQYLARDVHGRELAVMVFGAAAWQVAARDRFIGWSAPQRARHLAGLANQQRFLILPWVHVPGLASHLLALATRRLAADWQARYGHPVWLAETFVDVTRFAATAYRAAGWLYLGPTTGRTRQDRQHRLHTSLKAVWVRPLHPRFREHLTPS
jgi:hypothetical protein